MISALILTLNEEQNLPACLESVSWSDELIVFDSLSTDRTVEIAKAHGARVVQQQFHGYASQRNAALTAEFKNKWVLMLDADEHVPEDLRREMLEVVNSAPENVSMFFMRRKDFFMGRWLRRSSGYPTWFGRLIRAGHVWVEREVNEEYHTEGEVRYLRGHLHHFPFSKGIEFWFERHNRYSTMEASALMAAKNEPLRAASLVSANPSLRRKTAKQIFYRMPLRPFAVLSYLLIIRGGLLDGRPGISFAVLRAIYEHMIEMKSAELRRRKLGLPL